MDLLRPFESEAMTASLCNPLVGYSVPLKGIKAKGWIAKTRQNGQVTAIPVLQAWRAYYQRRKATQLSSALI